CSMYASTGARSLPPRGGPVSSDRVRRLFLLCACGLASCEAPVLGSAAALPVAVAQEPVPPEAAADDQSGPWFTLATSVEGRPIRAATLGHGPRRVLWVGGIHGDEREGPYVT